jgi:cytochrome oxidase Cu insertion factor (SCO1/SenC/PrrC family)
MRVVGLLLALCALVAAGCGGGSPMEEATPPADTMPPAEAAKRPPAPPIEGVSLDGERISLADLRGKPVFVNVWSSW